ncbi:hypothetical protein CBOM_01547 [Ceraceosorus bombacis]|uniref:Uncharacterized protein n=1 Tax=Ceraceosorus bombacis TaxID=401625 RepID=A0A0N7L9F5_9BASI|nr:hypothetical protein CBOM_01547 [Ceraceosorus bombacis]
MAVAASTNVPRYVSRRMAPAACTGTPFRATEVPDDIHRDLSGGMERLRGHDICTYRTVLPSQRVRTNGPKDFDVDGKLGSEDARLPELRWTAQMTGHSSNTALIEMLSETAPQRSRETCRANLSESWTCSESEWVALESQELKSQIPIQD